MICTIERSIPSEIPSTIPTNNVTQNVAISNRDSILFFFHNSIGSFASNKLKTADIIIAASTASGRWKKSGVKNKRVNAIKDAANSDERGVDAPA